jgi:hypothetical protein
MTELGSGGTSVRRTLLLVLAIAGFGTAAHAGDGRIEINQTCALAGCFDGDAAGFPVTTAAGQSYVLTSNLVVPTANHSGVTLAERASLDLNGFAIEGVTSCSGAPLECSGTGTGDGVTVGAFSSVRNGAIRKMGRYGVVGSTTTIENVTVEQCGSDGGHLASAHGTIVRNSRFQANGGAGFTTAFGAVAEGTIVTSNVFHANKTNGFVGGRASLIGNIASKNEGYGFYLAYGTTGIAHNTLIGNNGGEANQQIGGSSYVQIGPNACGGDTTCP